MRWRYVCPLSEEHRRQQHRFLKLPFDNEEDLLQRSIAAWKVLNHRLMQLDAKRREQHATDDRPSQLRKDGRKTSILGQGCRGHERGS